MKLLVACHGFVVLLFVMTLMELFLFLRCIKTAQDMERYALCQCPTHFGYLLYADTKVVFMPVVSEDINCIAMNYGSFC